MFRSRPVSLALVALFVWMTACSSYKQIELNEVADYGEVRVTLTDGERIVVPQDAFTADSFYIWKEYEPNSHHEVRVWHTLDDVTVFEARQHDRTKTVLFVFGVIVVPVAIVAIACSASECDLGIGYGSGN